MTHKHSIRSFAALALTALTIGGAILTGCGSKPDIKPIAGWERYEDPYVRVSFSYPKDWFVSADGGTISIFSSQACAPKFLDQSAQVPDGSQLVIISTKLDTVKTAQQLLDQFASEQSAAGFKVEPVQGRTFAGMPAVAIKYSGAFNKSLKLHAEHVMVVKDSMLYTIHYGGFNEFAQAYKPAFDTLLASYTLPSATTGASGVDPALPSPKFDTFDNFAVSIQYPSNFDCVIPTKKGEALFSMDVKGYRQDCNVHVDLLPAKGLTVDKIVDQNTKFYKSTSKGETKIDGQKAVYLNYSPAKNIQSRVYFVVKGDKFARVIVNVFQPMKDAFLPAFEKAVGTLKVK